MVRKYMYIVAIGITLFMLGNCSSITGPEEFEVGYLTYRSVIGKTYYCKNNVAACLSGEMTTYFSSTVEKWQFYEDSIVVLATHYNSRTKQALDQFKYVAQIIGEIDRVWTDVHGDKNRTTKTVWKVYSRSMVNVCDWAPIYSFSSPPQELFIDTAPKPNTCLGIGTYECPVYFSLLDTFPSWIGIWYPEGWVGEICGDLPY